MNRLRWIFTLFFVGNCCLFTVVGTILVLAPTPKSNSGQQVHLRVGYSPEKEALFRDLVDTFNSQNRDYRITATRIDPIDLVDSAVSGNFDAITPDSAIWFDQIERAWHAEHGDERVLTGSLARYAASPIVIAAPERVARTLGYPTQPVRWSTILERAGSQQLRWSHPSSATAMGLLAMTAEFYAAAGNPARLSREDVTRPAVIETVRRYESVVQQYGTETEDVRLQRLLSGELNIDAFVAQEQFVVTYNRQTRGEKLVALYPADGTLWLDHPIALLDGPWITDTNRRAYQAFREFLASPDTGQRVLAAGYRPADMRLGIDDSASPIHTGNGVDPAQPFTTLPLPATAVLEQIRDSWALLKRPANIMLVVDVSGSMDDDNRLPRAKEALASFLDQIKDGRDRIGLVTFETVVEQPVKLDTLDRNRAALNRAVDSLKAGGNTALYDAIDYAAEQLALQGDAERINVILVMTDGEENGSAQRLRAGRGDPSRLIASLESRHPAGKPTLVFTVAYGREAEASTLERIAKATGAQAYQSDPSTIRKLYRMLSGAF